MRKDKKDNKKSPYGLIDTSSSVRMSICSNREVIFEGSRGILEYCDSSIKINTGKYIVAFTGRGLHIKTMTEYDICIRGFITSIEYVL